MERGLDVKKRFTEEQIVGFLKEAEGGVGVKDLCRRHGFSEGSYYVWRSKYGVTCWVFPDQLKLVVGISVTGR